MHWYLTYRIQALTKDAQIAVIADNQDHLVSLPNTIQDASLMHSLISKPKALATQGHIHRIPALTSPSTPITPTLISASAITLRWRSSHALKSCQERFYIIDTLPLGFDAIFRGNIDDIASPSLPIPIAASTAPTSEQNPCLGLPHPRHASHPQPVPTANPIFSGNPGKSGRKDAELREEEKKRLQREYEVAVKRQREQIQLQLSGKGKGARSGGGGKVK
jgi:hypothetical protein